MGHTGQLVCPLALSLHSSTTFGNTIIPSVPGQGCSPGLTVAQLLLGSGFSPSLDGKGKPRNQEKSQPMESLRLEKTFKIIKSNLESLPGGDGPWVHPESTCQASVPPLSQPGFSGISGFFGKAIGVEHLDAHSNTVTLQRQKAAWGILVRCGWSRDTSPEDPAEELGTFHCRGWGFPSPMQAIGTRSLQPHRCV